MSVGKKGRKWQARISVNRRRIQIGTFATKAEARKAYADALVAYGPQRTRTWAPPGDPRSRFFSKAAPHESGCLLWTGAVDKDGYGRFQLNGDGRQTHVRSHRYAFFLQHGRWPKGILLHSCDVPGCVNHEHLSEGTQRENLIQCIDRGRRPDVVLDVGAVRSVRQRHAAGESVTAIARDLGIQRGTISGAVHRHTWMRVE